MELRVELRSVCKSVDGGKGNKSSVGPPVISKVQIAPSSCPHTMVTGGNRCGCFVWWLLSAPGIPTPTPTPAPTPTPTPSTALTVASLVGREVVLCVVLCVVGWAWVMVGGAVLCVALCVTDVVVCAVMLVVSCVL